MKKPTSFTHLGRTGGRSTSRTKITAARANGRKGGRPAKGGVYACRWPDGDLTLVFARNKTDAMARLDEAGNPDGLEIRQLEEMLVQLTLTDAGRLAVVDPDDCDWGEPVVARGRAGDLDVVEYPILAEVLGDLADEMDGAHARRYSRQQQARITAAVARERGRVTRGERPTATTGPVSQRLADQLDMPVALMDQIARAEKAR